MSLFGGDTRRSIPKAEPHSPSPLRESQSPLHNTQTEPYLPPIFQSWSDSVEGNPQHELEGVEDEQDIGDSSVESDESSTRPNRFNGSPSAWRKYTSTDRRIASALEQTAAGNLSAHLYNTHALKRKVRLLNEDLRNRDLENWRSKDKWMRQGEELDFVGPDGELQRDLVPWKRWTAWPLEEEDVPGPEEKFGRKEGGKAEDSWTFGGLSEDGVGNEMRGEILGVFMRHAKMKWMGRESMVGENSREDDDGPHEIEGGDWQGPRSGSRSMSIKHSDSRGSSANPSAQSDVEMQDSGTEASGIEEASRSYTSAKRRRGISKASRPDILADDDRARAILQPSINSILSHLDRLADAIRRTRMNHFADDDTSGSEGTSDGDSVREPNSRSRRGLCPKSGSKQNSKLRPTKKRYPSRTSSRASSVSYAETPAALDPSILADDSSGSDDYAPEDQKQTSKTGWTDDDLREPESPLKAKHKGSRASSRPRSSGSGSDSEADYRAGLMDWSEVLGLAALTGWNERVIDRTAKRCAALFNEGISFRSLEETTAKSAQPTLYLPGTIFSSNSQGLETSVTKTEAVQKHPHWEHGMVTCPHTECFGHHKVFPIPYRLVEHIIRRHGYDPRVQAAEDEEEMYGGVSVDGYMKPITAKFGWRGSDRNSRSRSRSRPRSKRKPDNSEEEENSN